MVTYATDQQEFRTLWCVSCGLQRMWYTRGEVPQIAGILETSVIGRPGGNTQSLTTIAT